MCVGIPPEHTVSNVVGYMKGKSAISIARNFMRRKRNFTGESFWVRGYFVSTIALDEEVVKQYVRDQERENERRNLEKLLQVPAGPKIAIHQD
jgi:putative transposase